MYVGNYSGRGKLLRMLFVAERLPDALAVELLKAALVEAKNGVDTNLYSQVCVLLSCCGVSASVLSGPIAIT